MSELSDTARALLEAGRRDRPSPEDRARLGKAIDALRTARPGRFPKKLSAGVALGGGLVALAVWLAWPEPVARTEPPVRAATADVPPPPPMPPSAEAIASPREPVPPAHDTPRATPTQVHAQRLSLPAAAASAPEPQPQPTASALAEELALMRSAQNALAAGQPQEALASVERHEAKFPQGILREERDAARVFALHGLGRTDEACERANVFLSATPQSPQAGRVRAFSARECRAGEK